MMNVEESIQDPQMVTSTSSQVVKILSVVFICVLLSTIGLLISLHTHKTPSTTISRSLSVQTQSPMPVTPTPKPTPQSGMTILVMGDGGNGHDGGALTDTMLLVRIMNDTKKILMLSIPRDLWVSIPYDGKSGVQGKINSAYALGITKYAPFAIPGTNHADLNWKLPQYSGTDGGGKLAEAVVTQVTGLSVDQYITIDFSGFEQAIDSIQGVDITVNPSFTDDEYPIAGRESTDCTAYTPTANAHDSYGHSVTSIADLISSGKLNASVLTGLPSQFPCRYEQLHFDAGLQHMDGPTALKYVRSRHSIQQGNDFSRGNRQRQLIQAVEEKLFSLKAVTKIPTFLTTIRSHIDTDISIPDILALLPQAATLHSYQIIQRALTIDNYLSQGFTQNGQYELLPLTGQTNYAAIQNWIASSITPSIPLTYPTIEIDADPRNASASAQIIAELTQAGFPTHKGILNPKEATTSATLILQNPIIDSQVIDSIAKIISVDLLRTNITVANSAFDIRIIVPSPSLSIGKK